MKRTNCLAECQTVDGATTALAILGSVSPRFVLSTMERLKRGVHPNFGQYFHRKEKGDDALLGSCLYKESSAFRYGGCVCPRYAAGATKLRVKELREKCCRFFFFFKEKVIVTPATVSVHESVSGGVSE